jgi:hypothetical protein
MTDKQVTQVAIEQWVTGTPAARATQVSAEHWASVATLQPGAAEMDGQAQAAFTGSRIFAGAAEMDGQAQTQFAGAIVGTGAARMDGQAQVLAAGAAKAYGAARMDGAASMAATVPLGIHANMDGAASMTAVGASDATGHHIVGMLQNLGMHDRIVVGFSPVLKDGIVASHSSKTMTRYHPVVTNQIFVQPFPLPTRNVIMALAQNLTVSFSLWEKFIWGRTLVQAFKVSAAASASGVYKKILTQLFKLSDIGGLSHTIQLLLRQGIGLSLSLIGGISLKLLQKFLAVSATSPAFTYHFALVSRVVVSPFIDKLFFAIIQQLFTVHPALGRQFIAGGSLAQLLTVHPALTNKLVLQLVGNFQMSPSQLVHMLYRGDPLLDGVVITALYISPSGTTTTWAVNTRTNAVTEYLNYDFNSFALLNGRYIASSSDGLYELDGDTDDGASIISELMSGYFQFNEKKLFGIKGAYVAIRGGGRFYLKLISGDGREYVYELKAQPNFMTTKIKVGKGIRTTYMAFDLVTEGQDFDLDSLEFIPMTSGRRV